MVSYSIFLPGKSREQRSLAGYSPWGHIELDTTEATEHARMQEICLVMVQASGTCLLPFILFK